MDRIVTTVLATLAGTIFAFFGVQAQPQSEKVSTQQVWVIEEVVELPKLATTTTAEATTTTSTTMVAIVAQATIPQDQAKRCPRWEPLFAEYGLPVETFSYIAWRESGCNPNAINAKWDKNGNMTYHLNKNKTWDSGLLQINSSWIRSVRAVCGIEEPTSMRQDLEVLFDPVCNVKFARWIMDNTSGGLANWNL